MQGAVCSEPNAGGRDDMGPTPLHVVLTPRERDIVRGIIAGRTNREMARELGLNEQSVRNVLSTVYQKCHVRNRLELALSVVKRGLAVDK
jgi:two-component system nitrate/nitrite response regulator NarL